MIWWASPGPYNSKWATCPFHEFRKRLKQYAHNKYKKGRFGATWNYSQKSETDDSVHIVSFKIHDATTTILTYYWSRYSSNNNHHQWTTTLAALTNSITTTPPSFSTKMSQQQQQNSSSSTSVNDAYTLLFESLSLIPTSHYIIALCICLLTFLYTFLEFHFLHDFFTGFRGSAVQLTFNSSPFGLYNRVVSKCGVLHSRLYFIALIWRCFGFDLCFCDEWLMMDLGTCRRFGFRVRIYRRRSCISLEGLRDLATLGHHWRFWFYLFIFIVLMLIKSLITMICWMFWYWCTGSCLPN